jgi:hypothetical protein
MYGAVLYYALKLTKNYFCSYNIISCSITVLELPGVAVDTRDSMFISYSISPITQDIKLVAIDKLLLKRRNRIITLPTSSYYYVENSAPNTLSHYYSNSRQPPSLPYPPSGYPDPTNDYKDAPKNPKEKEEIRGMYEGDIAD